MEPDWLNEEFRRRERHQSLVLWATCLAPAVVPGVYALIALLMVQERLGERVAIMMIGLIGYFPALLLCAVLSRLIALFKDLRYKLWSYLIGGIVFGGLFGGFILAPFFYGPFLLFGQASASWKMQMGLRWALWGGGLGLLVAFVYWRLAPYRKLAPAPSSRGDESQHELRGA